MVKLVWVALGGALGAVSRYLVSGWAHQWVQTTFPIGTLTVNILGCGLIGFLTGLSETREWLSPELRLLLLVGVLGGFTTFSTFGFETFSMLRDGEWTRALVNVGLQMVLGLLAVWLGVMLAFRMGQ